MSLHYVLLHIVIIIIRIGGGSSSYSNREYDIQVHPPFMGVGIICMKIVSKQNFPWLCYKHCAGYV